MTRRNQAFREQASPALLAVYDRLVHGMVGRDATVMACFQEWGSGGCSLEEAFGLAVTSLVQSKDALLADVVQLQEKLPVTVWQYLPPLTPSSAGDRVRRVMEFARPKDGFLVPFTATPVCCDVALLTDLERAALMNIPDEADTPTVVERADAG